MASWKESKGIGILAGAAAVIALIILIGVSARKNTVKISPETRARMEEVTMKMRQMGEVK